MVQDVTALARKIGDLEKLQDTKSIAVIGARGNGKSSNVSSVSSAISQELDFPAAAGGGAESWTKENRDYRIEVPAPDDSSWSTLPPYWDTPGDTFDVRIWQRSQWCLVHEQTVHELMHCLKEVVCELDKVVRGTELEPLHQVTNVT